MALIAKDAYGVALFMFILFDMGYGELKRDVIDWPLCKEGSIFASANETIANPPIYVQKRTKIRGHSWIAGTKSGRPIKWPAWGP